MMKVEDYTPAMSKSQFLHKNSRFENHPIEVTLILILLLKKKYSFA